jgi:hypothetical protein
MTSRVLIPPVRKPITGIAFCSRAPSGHAAAAPPTNPRRSRLVGAREERLWHGEAERLGGLEIDDQLDPGALVDRQIGGFLTLEDPSGVPSDQSWGGIRREGRTRPSL